MTMQFVPNLAIPTADGTLIYLFEFLDFMRGAPGWTIPRSSDGVTGGAGDNIAAFADLSQYNAGVGESWFVLRQPDGGREYLWFRTSATDTQWALSYSPTAVFVGGDAGNPPTAADELVIHVTDGIITQANNVLHMGADDAAPYGWFTYLNASGDLSNGQGAYAQIPITDSVQSGDTDAMVFYFDAGGTGYLETGIASENTSTTVARCAGITPGAATWDAISGLKFSSQAGAIFPDDNALTTLGRDVSMPIAFARRSGLPAPSGFKGFTDFMQWNGFIRAPGETFSSLTRISLGAVNFPWDGTTVPSAS